MDPWWVRHALYCKTHEGNSKQITTGIHEDWTEKKNQIPKGEEQILFNYSLFIKIPSQTTANTSVSVFDLLHSLTAWCLKTLFSHGAEQGSRLRSFQYLRPLLLHDLSLLFSTKDLTRYSRIPLTKTKAKCPVLQKKNMLSIYNLLFYLKKLNAIFKENAPARSGGDAFVQITFGLFVSLVTGR